jgi:hypothetical protein
MELLTANITFEASIGASSSILTGSLPSGDNNIGNVDIVTQPADTFAADAQAYGKGVLCQGDDGTDRRAILVGTDGHVQVDVLSAPSTAVTNAGTFAVQVVDTSFAVADGNALGEGVLIQGDDGSDRKNVNVDGTTGDVQVDLTAGTAVVGKVRLVTASGDEITEDTDNSINVSIVADDVGIGGGTQYTEDVATANPQVGNAIMVERDDQLSAVTPAEADWIGLRGTAKGALWVALADASGDPITAFGGGTEYTEDVATANPIVGKAIMMERDDALSALTPVEGDWAGARCDANGALWTATNILIPGTAATNLGKAIDSAVGATDTGIALLAKHNSDAVHLTTAEADYDVLRIGDLGGLHVSPEQHHIVDSMNATTGWSVLGNDTTNLATTKKHVIGTDALTFDKVDGAADTIFAGIQKTITSIDLGSVSPHDVVQSPCYIPAITDVAYVFLRLGTDSSNYNEWRIEDTALTAATYEILLFNIGDASYAGITGNGWNPSAVTYAAIGVAFDAETDTLAGIVFDEISFHTNMHTSAELNAEVSSSVSSANVNLQKVGGSVVDKGAGNVSNGCQRVVLATDDVNAAAIKAAVEIMDDWDDANYCNVNLNIAGTDVSANAGVLDAQTQRVTIATDDECNNLLGTIDADTGAIKTAVELIDNIVPSINGPAAPTIDSYTQAAINLNAGANQVLASSAASKQIWVYSIAFTCSVAGTVSFQDEDDTAISGIMDFAANSGMSLGPSGNFAMPIWKLGTDKDLEVDVVTAAIDGWVSYAVVSV